MNKQRLVAHRGDNTNHPENSYSGIKAALEMGALYIEFDVQMNADSTLVVLHDSDFKRTANLDLSVFNMEDKQIDSISIHEPKRFAQKHYPTSLSTLPEMMSLISQYPSVTVFVEIKEESLDHFGLKVVMNKLLEELKTHEAQAVIISFSYEAIEYVRTRNGHKKGNSISSSFKTGWVFEKVDEYHRQKALKLTPEYLFCYYKEFLPETAQAPWKGSWKWAVYTINEIETAQQMIKKDIDLIETNDISLLLNAEN